MSAVHKSHVVVGFTATKVEKTLSKKELKAQKKKALRAKLKKVMNENKKVLAQSTQVNQEASKKLQKAREEVKSSEKRTIEVLKTGEANGAVVDREVLKPIENIQSVAGRVVTPSLIMEPVTKVPTPSIIFDSPKLSIAPSKKNVLPEKKSTKKEILHKISVAKHEVKKVLEEHVQVENGVEGQLEEVRKEVAVSKVRSEQVLLKGEKNDISTDSQVQAVLEEVVQGATELSDIAPVASSSGSIIFPSPQLEEAIPVVNTPKPAVSIDSTSSVPVESVKKKKRSKFRSFLIIVFSPIIWIFKALRAFFKWVQKLFIKKN